MGDTPQAIAYEVALRRLDSQLARIEAIENKAAMVLGLASTLIAIFAGASALAADDLTSVAVASPFGLAILALYLCIMRIGLTSILTRDWDERPNWDALLESARELDIESLQVWVAEGCVLSLHANEPKIQQKAKDINRAIQLTVRYSVLIAVGLFAVFLVSAAA